jgi:serine/threonine protein kinase
MLEKDPAKRLTAVECLLHPFFKGAEGDQTDLVAEDDSNLDEMHAAEIGKLKDK